MKAPFLHRHYLGAVGAVLGLFLTHTSLAAEDDSEHALQALETALHDAAAAPRTTPARGREGDEVDSMFAGRGGDTSAGWAEQVRGYLEQGQSEQAERLLSELAASAKAEPVLTACRKLREEIHHERDAKEQTALKRYHDAAAAAESAVKSARVPADLDAALRGLSDLGNSREDYRASPAVQAEASRVQTVRRYVILWQDYLASLAYGDKQTATEKLRSISQDSSAEILPRSEILARIEELKTSQQTSVVDRSGEILGKLKTPAQIADVVGELQTLQSHAGNNYTNNSGNINLGYIIGELQSYAEIYHTYQAGLPVSIESLANRSWSTLPPPPAEVQNIKAQLLRLLCVRALNLEDRLKPDANEAISGYLDRVLADARERGDARMILRVRDIQRQTGPRTGTYAMPPSTAVTGALEAILAAQNQEEAGQYVPAVVSYERALKNGSDVVPAKSIGARLDAIKSAHPAEYEKGLRISLGVADGDSGSNLLTR